MLKEQLKVTDMTLTVILSDLTIGLLEGISLLFAFVIGTDLVNKTIRYFRGCNVWTIVDGFEVLFWCSEKKHKKIEIILESLPKEIGKTADENGLAIKVLSSDLFTSALKQKGENWLLAHMYAGMFSPASNEILINADFPGLEDTIAHELAHFCDFVRGETFFFSENDEALEKEFKKQRIFSLVPLYNRKDHQEFLAYCMSNYICKKTRKLSAEMVRLSEDYLLAIKNN